MAKPKSIQSQNITLPCYDLILHGRLKLNEIRRKPAYSHYDLPVPFGVGLRFLYIYVIYEELELLLGSFYNFILQIFVKIDEIIRKSRNSDSKACVFFRICLRAYHIFNRRVG